MIEFQHKLPTLHCEGRSCGTYNNRELGFPSILTTIDPDLGLFLHQLRNNIYSDRSLVFVDGQILMTDPDLHPLRRGASSDSAGADSGRRPHEAGFSERYSVEKASVALRCGYVFPRCLK